MQKLPLVGPFISDSLPSPGQRVELICEHLGVLHVLALLCSWTEDGWIVAGSRRRVAGDVVGWRKPLPMRGFLQAALVIETKPIVP